ncbi:MAG: (E)-4-hydroxy-3-methylbut-2-enyl-diphosphate synthase [Verrucomicrobia bacterium]|nr:(E)-4-hydroxy-3-methylbut-2-enyl-diphosphate synthase [Verrucomicrobiota bacterium]
MRYCRSPFAHERRTTREVVVGDPARGGVIIGGDHPVVVQSMLTCDTMDTSECVQQTLDLAKVGCELVRITAPTVKDAANLKNIVAELRAKSCLVPIVADIHFKPEAAMEAAKWVEKVRVNPGNYADSKKFLVKEYTDAQYAAELVRIEEKFAPLAKLCQELGRAMRIGTNHGSLSDRIMNRYGDTPLGMVESALEFANIARKLDFHNFVFSMKASNPKVMIECYRLLVARLEELGPDWNYPIHLGVTEAGEGEDGRIKSAIGIGSLLCDGLGDTIRVSLTEDSPHEIPVCRDLLEQVPFLTVAADERRLTSPKSEIQNPKSKMDPGALASMASWPFDPFAYQRRPTPEVELMDGVKCGGEQTIRAVVTRGTWDKVAPKIRPRDDVKPEAVYEDLNVFEIDPAADFKVNCETQLVTVKDGVALPAIPAFRLLAAKLKRLGLNNPILLKDCLQFPETPLEPRIALLRAAVVIGSLLADGIGDAILVRGESGGGQSLRLAYNILQAVGSRSFKTDYVACPSCGRTLFNLQTVTARIKARTSHLKGVKIAIMGCIVNGPGEMADADFGYVGGAPGKINLYVGKSPVKFNIPEAEAVDRLVDLIREHGKWVEPELREVSSVPERV